MKRKKLADKQKEKELEEKNKKRKNKADFSPKQRT